MEAQPQPPLPCSALGSSGALSLPGPPGSRNKTAVPVWGGAQEPQGKQVPWSKLPSPDPTHARRVTRAEPQAGGATENTGRSRRGAGHSACTPALACPQATFPRAQEELSSWTPLQETAHTHKYLSQVEDGQAGGQHFTKPGPGALLQGGPTPVTLATG